MSKLSVAPLHLAAALLVGCSGSGPIQARNGGQGGGGTGGGAAGATGGAAGSTPTGGGAGGAIPVGGSGGALSTGGTAGLGSDAGGGGGTALGGATGAGGQGASLGCDGLTAGLPIPPDHPLPATQYETTVDTVTDIVTGLMWQRKVSTTDQVSLGGRPGCSKPGLAGFSDWRAPTVLELATIIDFAVEDPAIAAATFPDTPSDFFGTATDLSMHSGSKWTVDFKTGLTVNGSPPWGYIRCVRQAFPKLCISGPRFSVSDKTSAANGAATVVDQTSTLPWQRDPSVDPLSWEQAKQYCSAFGRGAHLPTAKELLSLVDWAARAAIDVDFFPNGPRGDYWTATPRPGSTTEALTVFFGDATYTGTHTALVTEPHQVRCVLNP